MSSENDYLNIPLPLDNNPQADSKLPPLEFTKSNTPAPAGGVTPSSHIRTFESESKLVRQETTQFQRPLIKGANATRVRTFHTKLADAAIKFLEDQINEWLDANPDIEVKFSNSTVGTVEGKRAEPHLIVTIWY
jgi:hypothetical protein